ncbi:acyl carrier protein [Streptomyces sp. NPDC056296]|uniref:acyl carrier protein n=1 Tax=Streptomyces sp. NPDC056296 TaxID=3345775 RepID=UPI0035DC4DF0
MTTVDTHRITDFVLGVIRDMLNMPLPPTISPATPLGADGLELESLSFVELTVHVEREYGIQVDDETVDGFAHTTLGELVAGIRARIADEAPAGGPSAASPEPESFGPESPGLLDVKRLLALSQIIPAADPDDIADDADVVLDSLTVVWFLYQLKEQHGIELEIDHAQAADITSVGALHDFLRAQVGLLAGAGEPRGEVVGS